LRGVVGEMNNARRNLVKRAFDKLDKNRNGVVELDDIRGVYNAK
jgi:Ca2+-binding EF-hand superfamily protein